MTADGFRVIFQEVITSVLGVGAEVKVLITDGLQKNISAMQMLGAFGNQPFFFIGGRRIVTVVDPPHTC